MTEGTDFIDRLLFNRQMAGYLRSAHITVPVDQYMMLTILLTVLSVLLMMMVGVLLYVFDISLDLIPFLPQWLTMLLVIVLIPAGVFVCLYYYPQLAAQGRKTKIEMDLPYAITYMQALSSTITLYDIFRSVYDAADLYGEVSKECGLIVRDVELFGEDLLTAIENTIAVTPSENFRELLNDLMLVYRSGGNLTNFFNAKSESYRELARQELEALLQFLEMIAEIYVTAFVAGPIAIIIMLVAQNLSGQSQMAGIMPLMYIGLPLGAVVLIFILSILLPPDNLDIARREVRDSEYGSEILAPGTKTEPDAAFLKQLNSRKQMLRLLDTVKHPIKFFYLGLPYRPCDRLHSRGSGVSHVSASVDQGSMLEGELLGIYPKKPITDIYEYAAWCRELAERFKELAEYYDQESKDTIRAIEVCDLESDTYELAEEKTGRATSPIQLDVLKQDYPEKWEQSLRIKPDAAAKILGRDEIKKIIIRRYGKEVWQNSAYCSVEVLKGLLPIQERPKYITVQENKRKVIRRKALPEVRE